MTSWWLFPPRTAEVQFDEKWSFVGKKQARCDPQEPADRQQGDNWDHVAFDPEHRLVVSVVPGKRSEENVTKLVQDFKRRTGGRLMRLMTSDEYRPYKTAILRAYGKKITPPPTGRPGRPPGARLEPRRGLHYGVVHKTRRKGRVVKVETRAVFGSERTLRRALAASPVSRAINTSFVERHNGTDRHHNARKRRKTYCFSKDWQVHEAMTYFTMCSYNFCWPVRTLRQEVEGHWQPCTPAMAAGLADHVWLLSEWLTFPAVLQT